MKPCDAGRILTRTGDPDFGTPCTQVGQQMLHIAGDPSMDIPDLVLVMCHHHMGLLEREKMLVEDD